MKITEHIRKNRGKTLFSLEILPPLKGQNINSVYEIIDPVLNYQPAFVDVTLHREEFEYKEVKGGLLERRLVKRRPGTVAICAAIQTKYKIDAVPHLLCGGFSKSETEEALIDLSFLGFDNVMALRGDALKSEVYFTPEADGNQYALDLVGQISAMNRGEYLGEEQPGASTDFCIGVAGYPEKHLEAPSLESDIHFLKEKVKAGAEYIITQMFFDNSKYFEFVEKCRATGIEVPIIPGLKPLSALKQLNQIPQRFKVDIPDELVREVVNAPDTGAIREIGIEWCIKQSRELIKWGAPVLHYFSNSRTDNICRIIEKVF
jgi:methylenetetrahydrofolate reductase (NADPH)